MQHSYAGIKKVLFPLFIGTGCLIAAFIIAFNIFTVVRHKSPPRPRQMNVQLIQGWMTLPYIARSYRISEPELFQKLDADRNNRRTSIKALADQKGITPSLELEKVREAVKQLQASISASQQSP